MSNYSVWHCIRPLYIQANTVRLKSIFDSIQEVNDFQVKI